MTIENSSCSKNKIHEQDCFGSNKKIVLMIAKLCAIDLIEKSKKAEINGKFDLADKYIKLAEQAMSCTKENITRIAQGIKQNGPNYMGTQRDLDTLTSAAAMAWVEYMGSLFSRIPANQGADAVAIAEYAKDLQSKVSKVSNLAMQEDVEARSNMQPFNITRQGDPIGNLSLMSEMGAGMAYKGKPSLRNWAKGAWESAKAPFAQGAQTGGRAKEEMKGVPGAVRENWKLNAPGTQNWGRNKNQKMLPYAEPGDSIKSGYYTDEKMRGKQYVTLGGYAQNVPFGITTEQIMGTGKGNYNINTQSSMYEQHPAFKNPASNSAGFKAMEACWLEYFYKYLPERGIVKGQLTGATGMPSAFANNAKVSKLAQAKNVPPSSTAPAPAVNIPPMPDTKPPAGAPDWKTAVVNKDQIAAKTTNADIPAEKRFYFEIFKEVEKRMSGKSDLGATLEGVVKKGAMAALFGKTLKQQQATEVGGQIAGDIAGNARAMMPGYTPATATP